MRYAVGWTQHTLGAQFIRTAAILQLLLGNVGRPGRRNHGAARPCQHPGLHRHPDPVQPAARVPPDAQGRPPRHAARIPAKPSRPTEQKGFWADADAYTISLLKAWWGDAANADNDWAYDYLPRLTGPHGTYQTVMSMLDDEVEGYFLLGQNPAVGSANGRMQRLGMSHLKWLVVRDLNLIESATWWKDGPEIASGELRTEDIEHRGLLLARRDPRGEGRLLHPDPAAAAMAAPGGAAAGGLPERTAVLLSSWASGSGRSWRIRPTNGTGRCWT